MDADFQFLAMVHGALSLVVTLLQTVAAGALAYGFSRTGSGVGWIICAAVCAVLFLASPLVVVFLHTLFPPDALIVLVQPRVAPILFAILVICFCAKSWPGLKRV